MSALALGISYGAISYGLGVSPLPAGSYISQASAATSPAAIAKTYADIAEAAYSDSLTTAKELKAAIDAFLKSPTDATLLKAKQAWLKARNPYQQTEAYRFGNKIVDEWEGKVNAWPLDEGLIDYVAKSYGAESEENSLYVANVIAKKSINIGGKTVDTTKITPKLLSESLHEAGEIEANVATGYHAIEFLLWGQDNNGTGPGAGKRPASDYDVKNCTNGNCDRRAAYLTAAVDLLITDLEWMVKQWGAKGAARMELSKDPNQALTTILTGMGSLSYGELAGERMKLGLMVHDPEEEHDCFSDNTHNSHYYDALGIQNVYLGTYKRIDGSVVKGPSLADLVNEKDAKLNTALKSDLAATLKAMQAMVDRANKGEAYDQMIGENNKEGNAVVQKAIDALLKQTKNIERVVAALKLKSIEFEGSDSLDAPEKVKAN